MKARSPAAMLVAAAIVVGAGAARAAGEGFEPPFAGGPDSRWMVGAQVTVIGQVSTRMTAPYSNPERSVGPDPLFGGSFSVSLFTAVRPWAGGALVFQPEFAAGRGLPHATGIAASPNGELVRVPSLGETPYVARFFFHQDIPLGPVDMDLPAAWESRFWAPTVFGRTRAAPRIEITVGKVAMSDFFDRSPIGSDTRHHSLNRGLSNQGAWDQAGGARGTTWAAVIALETRRFALRGGAALMPAVANGSAFDLDLGHAHSEMVEGELRYTLSGRPGSAKLLAYMNRARMGNYRAALAAAHGQAPDITVVRLPAAARYGAGLLVDQQVSTDLALFFRAGINDGQTETFAFGEIDRSVSLGGELSGRPWGRDADRLGLGVALGGLSDAHRDYLRAGGVGLQLGDGRLNPGLEYVAELYYDVHLGKYVEITPDLQGCINPGMNRDRGPVAFVGLRVHGHL